MSEQAASTISRVDRGPRYTFVSRIAKGGIGYVDLVMRSEGRFRRLYARKRLHAHLRDDEDLRGMFLEEARIAGLIRHPNVVSVLDVGEDADGPFLLMDYVEGLPLSAIITSMQKRGELVPLQTCIRVIAQAAHGLASAHELGDHSGENLALVHRDVSPQNILVGFDGVVRVTDFGIAKVLGGDSHTTSQTLKGKYGYMSPEQLRFEPLDPRSDIFALGIVLWEALAGRRLYQTKALEETARRILHEPVRDLEEMRADVPPALEQLLLRMLAKGRDARPAGVRAVASELDAILRALLAEEEPYELSAFVDEHLAPLRDRHRAETNEAIRRAEGDAAAASASASASASAAGVQASPEVGDAAKPRERGGNRALVIGLVLAGVLVGAGVLLAAQSFMGDEGEEAAGAEAETGSGSGSGSESGSGTGTGTGTGTGSGSETGTGTGSETDTATEPTAPAMVAEATEAAPTMATGRRGRRTKRATMSPSSVDEWWSP